MKHIIAAIFALATLAAIACTDGAGTIFQAERGLCA